jgi:hypothetical protein
MRFIPNLILTINSNLMKKVNFKSFLMTLSVALAFILMGAVHAEAQSSALNATNAAGAGSGSSPKTLIIPPAGNFVTQAEALGIIEAHVLSLKAQFELFAPGTAAYGALEKEYAYYTGVFNALEKGFTVPEAIVEGLKEFTDAFGPVSNTAKALLKQDAVDKLSI